MTNVKSIISILKLEKMLDYVEFKTTFHLYPMVYALICEFWNNHYTSVLTLLTTCIVV